MTFAALKNHLIAPMKELPIEDRFGSDLMFTEHEQLRIDPGLEPGKSQRRGGFSGGAPDTLTVIATTAS